MCTKHLAATYDVEHKQIEFSPGTMIKHSTTYRTIINFRVKKQVCSFKWQYALLASAMSTLFVLCIQSVNQGGRHISL